MTQLNSRNLNVWESSWPKEPHDIRRIDSDFESVVQMQKERRHRIRLLQSGDTEQRQLANKLHVCRKGAQCLLAICPICMRRFRIWWVAEGLQRFASETELLMITLVPPAISVADGQLDLVSSKRIFDRHRQQLKRAAWFGPICGGMDGTYERETKEYQPHIHLIGPDSSREAFEALRRFYPKTATGAAGLVITPITNRAGALTYCFKGFWRQRVPFQDASGRRRSVKRRLDRAQELEWLTWQASCPATALLFLYCVRRYGHTLRRHSDITDGLRRPLRLS